MSADDTGERVGKYLENVLDTEVLLNVLLPVFFLPPRTGVYLLRPDKRCCFFVGVPVGVGGVT